MTSRIDLKFAELAGRRQKALIPYMMYGYPDERATMKAVRGMIRGGADIIELGFPFSDPLADGPVIQDAATSSLEHGSNLEGFFSFVGRVRARTEIPLVLMTYTNIMHRYGYRRFLNAAAKSGMDGIILPDMPVEESAEYLGAAGPHLDTIFLVSPNTSNARIQRISGISSGFLYLVAVYGTTGPKTGIKSYTVRAIRNAKRQTRGRIPVGVGFGVSAPADVRRYVKSGADAVIVGSAFLNLVKNTPRGQLEQKIARFTRSLKNETLP